MNKPEQGTEISMNNSWKLSICQDNKRSGYEKRGVFADPQGGALFTPQSFIQGQEFLQYITMSN